MRPIYITYAPTALDADAIATSQTPAGAGALTLDGVAVSGGVATLGNQQYVTIVSGSNISNRTFAIVGTDKNDNALTETITGPNNGTASSTKSFYTVSSVTISGAAAGALTVGVSGLGDSPPVPLNLYSDPFNVSVGVTAVTSATYKLQYTFDNIQAATWPNGTQVWFDHATMTGETTTADATLNNPITALRFSLSVAGSLSAVIVQSGGGT